MAGSKRSEGRRFTDEERMLAYLRILEGVSYVDIAQELDCSLKFLYRQFGTQRERAAAPAKRSPLRLSAQEREELSRGLHVGDSFRALARRLQRAPSTVSREVMANGGRAGYRAWRADERAVRSQRRPRALNLASSLGLRREVEERLTDLLVAAANQRPPAADVR